MYGRPLRSWRTKFLQRLRQRYLLCDCWMLCMYFDACGISHKHGSHNMLLVILRDWQVFYWRCVGLFQMRPRHVSIFCRTNCVCYSACRYIKVKTVPSQIINTLMTNVLVQATTLMVWERQRSPYVLPTHFL
jgi:hypothetical protein